MLEDTDTYKYALKLLCKRDYSRYKLKEKLKGKSFEDIDDVIDLLVEKRYLREDYYQEARVKGFMHKGYSPTWIQSKLAEEFCPTNLDFIYSIFKEYNVETQEQIDRLVSKKIPNEIPESYEDLFKMKGKILRFVLSKGHSMGAAQSVLERQIQEIKNS